MRMDSGGQVSGMEPTAGIATSKTRTRGTRQTANAALTLFIVSHSTSFSGFSAITRISSSAPASSSRHTHQFSLSTLLAFVASLIGLLYIFAGTGVHSWPTGLPNGVSVSGVSAGFAGWVTDIGFISARHSLVLTKDGRIHLLDNFYFSLPMRFKPLINLSTKVKPAGGDRGMVSIAIHPDFQNNPTQGFIYVGYVEDTHPECQGLGRICDMKWNKIRRFSLRWNGITQTYDVTDNRLVWGACTMMKESWWGDDCSPMVGTTHSIGSLWFGSDGKLWASLGEGQLLEGSFWTDSWKDFAGLDRALSMDPDFLGGKILRMEANTGDGILRGLSDNPFWNGNPRSARSMVWAVGLRNPWRCTHWPAGTTQQVLCGVVGQFSFESAVRIRKGSNLGWPCWEGNEPTPGGNIDVPACQRIYNEGAEALGYPRVDLSQVMFVYSHDGNSAAAIGGIVLPSYFPAPWAGRFLVTDYVRSTIWAINPNDNSVRVFAENADNIVSFKISPFDGNVYMVLECWTCASKGYIRRFDVAGRKYTTRPGLVSGSKTTKPGIPATTAKPVPNPLCNPPNPIQLNALPTEANGQKWETVMYLSKAGFPSARVQPLRNGGWGPIGIDSSVGPGPNQANKNSRVISIGSEYFTAGLGTKGISTVKIDFGGLKRCWKFVAKVGIDDEIWLKGPTQAWGEFTVYNGDMKSLLYNSTASRSTEGKQAVKVRELAYQVSVTNLDQINGITLNADMPRQGKYPFNFLNAHYDWASAKLYCGPDAPYVPIVNILTPKPGKTEYAIGQTVQFTGEAYYWDGKTKITNPGMFAWNVVLVHCQGYLCHQHSEVDGLRGFSGSFTVKDHAPDNQQYYFYEIQLAVTDGCGRMDRATKTVLVKGFSRQP